MVSTATAVSCGPRSQPLRRRPRRDDRRGGLVDRTWNHRVDAGKVPGPGPSVGSLDLRGRLRHAPVVFDELIGGAVERDDGHGPRRMTRGDVTDACHRRDRSEPIGHLAGEGRGEERAVGVPGRVDPPRIDALRGFDLVERGAHERDVGGPESCVEEGRDPGPLPLGGHGDEPLASAEGGETRGSTMELGPLAEAVQVDHERCGIAVGRRGWHVEQVVALGSVHRDRDLGRHGRGRRVPASRRPRRDRRAGRGGRRAVRTRSRVGA